MSFFNICNDNSKTKQQKSDEELKTNLIKHHRLLQPTELDYKQLEYQVISSITDEGIAMFTMLGRWYQYYQSHPRMLATIHQFAEQYQPANAVCWFTQSTFIYQFVNGFLCSGNIELSHNTRFYIAHMSGQLAELKRKQRELMTGVKVLYRGLRQSTQELEALKKLINNVITTKGFTSTSWNKQVALFFAGINQPESAETQSLLLEITVNFSSPVVIVADISSLSRFPEECEVLFDFGTKFRVKTLEFDRLNSIWFCQLSAPPTASLLTKSLAAGFTETNIFTDKATVLNKETCYESRRKFARTGTQLKQNEQWSTRQTLPWIVCNSVDRARMSLQIALRSWQQGDICQAAIYLENAVTLYKQEVVDQYELAHLSLLLGFMLYKIGKYSRAIEFAERSIAMILRMEPANNIVLARYFRILGLIYSAVNRIEDALACHDQALIIDKNLRSTEKWSMALTLRNLALIHRDRGDSARAAEYFTKAWIVFQEVSTTLRGSSY